MNERRINKQYRRIQKHFDERLTPQQQREQRHRAGLRKAARDSSRKRWRPGNDEDEVAGVERIRRGGPKSDRKLRRAGAVEPPPRGVLSRPDPHDPRRELVIATGLDLAVLVVSLRTPPLRRGLIDRFLVAVERGGIAPVLCINKIDLCSDGDLLELEQLLAPYAALGMTLLRCSAETRDGVPALRDALRGATCAFVGHSGVGKSSLLNALDPDGTRRTGQLRASDGKGRHTTTKSTATDLGNGTRVLDTPGIRSFGLWEMDRATLRAYFPEFEAYATGCKFGDCSHRHEPECGVRVAVEAGEIPQARFDSYLRIWETL